MAKARGRLGDWDIGATGDSNDLRSLPSGWYVYSCADDLGARPAMGLRRCALGQLYVLDEPHFPRPSRRGTIVLLAVDGAGDDRRDHLRGCVAQRLVPPTVRIGADIQLHVHVAVRVSCLRITHHQLGLARAEGRQPESRCSN